MECPEILKGMGDAKIAEVKSIIEIMKLKPFRLMLGVCLWMANTCRPDIIYIIHVLQRYQASPGIEHWDVLCPSGYLKKMRELSLIFKTLGSKELIGYLDTDWVRSINDQKSVSGYMFMLVGATIS